ncbi:TetR/AcrR family transcriptional regulator [Pseudoclavibacter chungangensis]|uniref:TetR/AcrR family transcriptional regulator n=1 Tax=Pseudoclavibacter chungangensis TaxID=587635 RepID=A0A7J5C484_9MICO|nr:TetR/AcrR family transcriptional regulator [Pseudoclavibacter chungangensis]KAB1662589.1 TetR/AcrR family transcriptional regulator [Pseudoclavibacter chungangensis]NYJ68637.1 DNA-binding transcriptional regulator YbjK [Pseudoclavibacter chungangensis]
MSERRTQVIGATLDVIADGGSRGLTHRAVDRRAGVPLGTTGNWFRTRNALVAAAVDELERRDLEAGRTLFEAGAPHDRAGLVRLVRAFLEGHLSGEGAVRARARYALMLERPDLVAPAHERLLATFAGLAGSIGVAVEPSAARRAADLVDGAILHRVTIRADAGDDELDALADAIVALLLGSPDDAPSASGR